MSVQSLDLLRILSSIKMHKQRGEKRHFGTLKEAEDEILSLLVVVATGNNQKNGLMFEVFTLNKALQLHKHDINIM